MENNRWLREDSTGRIRAAGWERQRGRRTTDTHGPNVDSSAFTHKADRRSHVPSKRKLSLTHQSVVQQVRVQAEGLRGGSMLEENRRNPGTVTLAAVGADPGRRPYLHHASDESRVAPRVLLREQVEDSLRIIVFFPRQLQA